MNHKRGKPKSSRSGCLLCKPHKHQANKHSHRSKQKKNAFEIENSANINNYHMHDKVSEF